MENPTPIRGEPARSSREASSSPDATARLEELLALYGDRVRRTIARLRPAGAHFDVDDILQEVSMRLWKALADEREITHPPSYLHRVAASAVIDALRRQRRRPEPVALEDDRGLPEPKQSGPSPDQMAEQSRLLAATSEALERLPENRRLAVRLYLQGHSSADIAELLNWSEPKARNLLYRGLGTLRGDLAAGGFEYEEDGER